MSWPNLADLLVSADADAPVALVGAPLGTGSVTPGRCDLAPATLRATLRRIGTYDVETGREISSAIADGGDVPLDGLSIEDATAPLAAAVAAAVGKRPLTLVVGGNNAVTRPALIGMAEALGLPLDKVGLVTLDAHFDMRDTSAGLSNGNPVRALRDDGLPGRNVAQIGLAPFANAASMHRDAMAGGHLVLSMAKVREIGIESCVSTALRRLAHCEAILVDCDIDVIDRGQMPGAPGARPGGMAAHDFFAAVRLLAADRRVRAIDLTEWDPPLDPSDLSALVATRWVAECLAGFERR
jgi:arginase family enzyme